MLTDSMNPFGQLPVPTTLEQLYDVLVRLSDSTDTSLLDLSDVQRDSSTMTIHLVSKPPGARRMIHNIVRLLWSE